MKHCIEKDNFSISFQLNVFESDIQYSSNTILTVAVESDGFCAESNMDIDIKEFAAFVDTLTALFSTLKGNAIIQEPYGQKQYISFSSDNTGHVFINGKLNSNGRNGFSQELVFENSIDQTYMPDFISSLSELCKKYI